MGEKRPGRSGGREKKSLAQWWRLLAENSVTLYQANILYLLCAAPAALGIFLFTVFHAYSFLLLVVPGLFLLGPAVAAVNSICFSCAEGVSRRMLVPFFRSYKAHLRKGVLWGLGANLALLLVAYPVYLAYVRGSAAFPLLLFCALLFLLLSLCLENGLAAGGDDRGVKDAVSKMACVGARGAWAGVLRLVWLLLLAAAPYYAVIFLLVGAPAVVRFSAGYLLAESQETEMEECERIGTERKKD